MSIVTANFKNQFQQIFQQIYSSQNGGPYIWVGSTLHLY